MVVQSLSPVWLFVTPWTAACQASLSYTISRFCSDLGTWHQGLMLSNLIILHHLLLLLPSIFLCIRVFSSESALRIMWPRDWNFSLSISPSNEYSALISFRVYWFALLAIQGLSRVFSNTTVQKHQFFVTQPSLWSNSHICKWLLEKP